MVLPNDTNTVEQPEWEKLIDWLDIVAAIACSKAFPMRNRLVRLPSADNISFKQPIARGEVVT